jgi:hypothetical protein
MLLRDFWDALKRTRRPAETTADTVRRLLAARLIVNETAKPIVAEGQTESGKVERS